MFGYRDQRERSPPALRWNRIMISLVARLLLTVPSLIAGWFVAEDDVAYWVVAFAIALVFIVLTIAFELYLHPLLGRRERPRGGDGQFRQ